jgi:DNA-binding transcriptional regulator YiaG
MGKLESTIKIEIVRLARRELRKVVVPLGRDVRALKVTASQLRKTVSALERFAARRDSELMSEKVKLQTSPEEMQKSRFSPRLIRRLRQRLGITQKELATLSGVTVGAIFQWEKGIFDPRDENKGVLVALRKLGRRDVKKLLEEKGREMAAKKAAAPKGKGRKSRGRKGKGKKSQGKKRMMRR